MEFLAQLPPDARERLIAGARRLAVPGGRRLIERGERNKDLYVILEGSFEIVDTRSRPEVILDRMGPGDVVGEMALIDDSPRTADVRAERDGLVYRWEARALEALLESDSGVAAAFWRAVASAAARRLRMTAATAVVGGLAADARVALRPNVEARASALAQAALERFIAADSMLGRDPADPRPAEAVETGLYDLMGAVQDWLGDNEDPIEAQQAGERIARELRPYLVRSGLGSLALDAGGRRAGDPRLHAHVLLNQPRGEGGLGRLLDQGLLAMPTCAALRARSQLAAERIRMQLPAEVPADLLLLNVTCGVLLAHLKLHLGRRGARVRAVDSSREALSWLDAGQGTRPPGVSLKLVQDDLAAIVAGRSASWHDLQDVVVVDSLVENVPERLLPGLFRWVAEHLKPTGCAVFTALGPTRDEAFFAHLLAWPTIRRPSTLLQELAESAGLRMKAEEEAGAGQVLIARLA